MPSWKKVIVSGSDAALNSLLVSGNTIISGSLAVGTSSIGPNENTITLGARDNGNEGGQIGFNAPGGTYTSASFIDNYTNLIRILKGNNTTSTGLVAQWNLHTAQMQLPAYTNASSFTGTATANLAVDSGGNIITVSTAGGTVFPYTGNATITGSLTVTQPIYVPINGGMYFRGGDDAELWDINVSNTLGIYGAQDTTIGSVKLGSGGGTISGKSGNIGINTTNPTSASLTVNGNVWATSFTGSLLGTALTASYVTASNVFGPYGSNSIISASNAVSSSYAATASYSQNLIISGSVNNVDYIDFNTGSATPAYRNGRIFWDNVEGALSVYNSEADITLQVGQENWTRVFNDSGVTIANGAPVRIIGTHGDHPEVVLAASIQVSGSSNLVNQILGLATHAIEDGTFGYVTTQGLVRGLNTSMFVDGDTLYLSSSAGQLTSTVPTAPYEIVPVGQVVKASPGGSGIIYVAVQQPLDFTDLSSVYLGSGTYEDGQLWSYDGPSKSWRHTRQLSGSYGVTGSLHVTNGSITSSLFGTASYSTSASTAISSSVASTSSYVNTLNQNVTISGSVTVTENFTVFGSSSIQYITSSQLNIGDNIISVNTINPSFRYGGLAVIDSGSAPQTSGSLLFDSQNNQWIFVHQSAAEAPITSSVLIMGPQTFDSVGNETTLTANRLTKGIGGDLGEHIGDSNITDNGTIVSINSNTEITGSLTVTDEIKGTGSHIDTNALIQASLLYLSNNF